MKRRLWFAWRTTPHSARARGPLLSPGQGWWLWGAVCCASLPLLPHLPPTFLLIFGLLMLWRAGAIYAQHAVPPSWMRAIALVALIALILWQYHSLLGQKPGISFLLCLTALKQIETQTRREAFILVPLTLFIALTGLIQDQSISSGVLMLLTVWIALSALLALHQRAIQPPRLLRQIAVLLAQSLPIALALFLLFPRISGPLWGLPRDAHTAISGLSDSMTPGAINKLALSDEIAFRVRFSGPTPPQAQLYWRGPVLSRFDGKTWRPGLSASPLTAAAFSTQAKHNGAEYHYELTLEPHNQPWLLALEHPQSLPSQAKITQDYQIIAERNITERQNIQLTARTDFVPGPTETANRLNANMQLPAQGNPRTRALAAQWRMQYGTPDAIRAAAEHDFRSRKLTYTLDPPELGADDIDAFLFDTRSGFCEHFAGAYVFALRAAGIPARVVTGYQGGERNPFDGDLTIRQSDAHAWAEVWQAGTGWIRIDPVAISAPTRIDQNIARAVPAGAPLPFMASGKLSWLRDFRQHWEAANAQWNRWVAGYDSNRQRDLLAKVGVPDWKMATIILASLCLAASVSLLFWALRQNTPQDAAQRLWLRIERTLYRRKRLRRLPTEPISDFAARAVATHPQLAATLGPLVRLYNRIRYAEERSLLAEFRRAVRHFCIGRMRL